MKKHTSVRLLACSLFAAFVFPIAPLQAQQTLPVPIAPAPAPQAVVPAAAVQEEQRMPPRPDVAISVSQDTLTQFAEAAMPLTLQGTNTVRLHLPVVGILEITVPWAAAVSQPRITIEKGGAKFEAEVDVTAAGVVYHDKVFGTFEIVHDEAKNQLSVAVREAFLNLRVKRRRVTAGALIDISKQVPSLELPIPLPASQVKIGGKTMQLALWPKVEYQDGAIVISSSVKLSPRKLSEY